MIFITFFVTQSFFYPFVLCPGHDISHGEEREVGTEDFQEYF